MAIPQDQWLRCGLAWAAKIACSGRYVTGRKPLDVLLESAAWTYSTPEDLQALRGGKPTDVLLEGVTLSEDLSQRAVTLEKAGQRATARMHGGGAVVVDDVHQPVRALPATNLAPQSEADDFFEKSDPTGIDLQQVQQALELVFSDPRQMTNAYLVLHKGQLVAERYRAPFHASTQFESWSMGKSLASTLIGRLHHRGEIDLEQQGLFKEWQDVDDPRRQVRLRHILNMSSGLKFTGSFGRGEDTAVKARDGFFLDHIYVYASGCDSYEFCVGKPLEIEPGSEVRYRNCDPLLAMRLLREHAGSDEAFANLPRDLLLNQIGAHGFVLETDPFGGFLISGHDYARARDWARLGQLWLQRGVWEGQRLLSETYVDFALTPAPGSDEPYYGGFIILNRSGIAAGLPADAFWFSGGGLQRTIVIPSKDLVIVRMGHILGARFKLDNTLQDANRLLCGAVG
ncbi:MAG: serine hydrolase [Pseudomonadota bacterium]